MKTNRLTGHALNWAVAQAEGDKVYRPRLGRPHDWDKEAYLADGSDDRWVVRVENPTLAWFVDWTYNPSASWMQGGPIIEREVPTLMRTNGGNWIAQGVYDYANDTEAQRYYGETPLVAAMRCYVASKLGDEVEIPAELLVDTANLKVKIRSRCGSPAFLGQMSDFSGDSNGSP